MPMILYRDNVQLAAVPSEADEEASRRPQRAPQPTLEVGSSILTTLGQTAALMGHVTVAV